MWLIEEVYSFTQWAILFFVESTSKLSTFLMGRRKDIEKALKNLHQNLDIVGHQKISCAHWVTTIGTRHDDAMV